MLRRISLRTVRWSSSQTSDLPSLFHPMVFLPACCPQSANFATPIRTVSLGASLRTRHLQSLSAIRRCAHPTGAALAAFCKSFSSTQGYYRLIEPRRLAHFSRLYDLG